MKNKIFLTLTVIACSLVFSDKAFAHATPITYEPEASSLLEKIPERIRIHFSEQVERGASGIIVYAPDGARIDNHDAVVDSEDAHLYSATIKGAGEGTYTVSWQVVSADDGHFTKGAFTFSIGKESAAPQNTETQFQIVHSSTAAEAVTLWIELLGQAILLAGLFLYAFLWRPVESRFVFKEDIKNKFTKLILIASFLVIIGTVSYLVLKTLELQQLQNLTPLLSLQTFITTTAGKFALYRTILAIVFLAVFLGTRQKFSTEKRVSKTEVFLWVIILLIALARARVSHAAASHFYPNFSIFVNFIHLLAKNLWVGGLIAMSMLFLPVIDRTKNTIATAFALTSFSKFVSIAFGIGGVSGAYIVWLHLKDPSNIFTTDWGSRFIVLSILAVILFALRLYQQLRVDKAAMILCKEANNVRVKKVFSMLNFMLPIEMLVGIALIFVTSFLIITTPPLLQKNIFSKNAESQGVHITIAEHPFEQNQMLFAFEGAKREAVPLKNVVVTLTNEERSIGPIVAKTEQRFIGGYVFPKKEFSPPGVWKVDVTGQQVESYDAVATFQINFPQEIEASRPNPDKRTFGSFEWWVLFTALGIVGLSFLLYRFSRNLNSVCIGLNGEPLPNNGSTELRISQIRSWAFSLVSSTVLFLFIWSVYLNIIRSEFQRTCEQNGHLWHQMVPIRNGKVVSQMGVAGCMTHNGKFHFADKREYLYALQTKLISPESKSQKHEGHQ